MGRTRDNQNVPMPMASTTRQNTTMAKNKRISTPGQHPPRT